MPEFDGALALGCWCDPKLDAAIGLTTGVRCVVGNRLGFTLTKCRETRTVHTLV